MFLASVLQPIRPFRHYLCPAGYHVLSHACIFHDTWDIYIIAFTDIFSIIILGKLVRKVRFEDKCNHVDRQICRLHFYNPKRDLINCAYCSNFAIAPTIAQLVFSFCLNCTQILPQPCFYCAPTVRIDRWLNSQISIHIFILVKIYPLDAPIDPALLLINFRKQWIYLWLLIKISHIKVLNWR